MKNRKWVNGVIVLMVTALIGFGANVFAADPDQSTPMGRQGKGMHGDGPMMGDGAGMGKNMPNLTPEETQKFEAERNAFRDATKDLKRSIYQKHLELQSEMIKKDPDRNKATAIQKEISDLQAQMDQKRLEHRFNLKQINPDLGSGMGGFHKGMGNHSRGTMPKDCPMMK